MSSQPAYQQPLNDIPAVSQRRIVPDSVQSGELSARSQVLTNLDILELIFSFFNIYPTDNIFNHPVPEREERRYLLWTAITCRSFFEPAMSLLWRSRNSLWPLSTLIPVLIEVDDPSTYSNKVILRELGRFEFYAKRIRHLQFLSHPYVLPPHIVSSIMEFRQSKILPGLQSLSVSRWGEMNMNATSMEILSLLLTPALQQVSFSGINEGGEHNAAELLKTVSKEVKCLRDLKLEGQLSPTTLDLISEFRSLQNLHITLRSASGPTKQQILRATFLGGISEIESLKSLTLVFDSQVQFNDDAPRPGNRRQDKIQAVEAKYTMPSLNVLEILGPASTVNDILGSIKTPNLKEIAMNLITGRSTDGLLTVPSTTLRAGLIKILAENVKDCLESIKIISFSSEVQMPHETLNWFRHFNRLKYMQTSIEVVSKDTIPSIFLSGVWSSLVSLRLEAGTHTVSSRKVVSSLPLSQLVFFARFCPALTRLSISTWIFLAREDFRSMREEIKIDCLCHNLQELELLPFIDMDSYSGMSLAPVYGCRIQDVLTVSRFIDHIFPSLTRLDLSHLYVVDSEWCGDILAAFKEFQEVRRDGRHTCSKIK